MNGKWIPGPIYLAQTENLLLEKYRAESEKAAVATKSEIE